MASIDIGKNFSPTPSGRYIADGPYSGEAFREKHLKKALEKNNELLTINLDSAAGLGSSFLEEAFGGLVRLGYFSGQELLERLNLESEDQAVIDEIIYHIKSASE